MKGNHTSLITLLVRAGTSISDVNKHLTEEYGTATNIRSRVNRLSVLSAITTVQHRLKLYHHIPSNGLALFCGIADEKKILVDFEPPRPIKKAIYLCDNRFHTESIYDLLDDGPLFAFVIVAGDGFLLATLQGSSVKILHRESVDLPNHHRRGGQSSVRFARLRVEKRTNYLRKIAETMNLDLLPLLKKIKSIILAGPADLKNELAQSELIDKRLKSQILKTIDLSSTGEKGLNEAIDQSADLLGGLKYLEEKKEVQGFLTAIQTNQPVTFGLIETMRALEMGAVEKILLWDELDVIRHSNKDEITYSSKTLKLVGPQASHAIDKISLIEWLIESRSSFGINVVLLSDATPEGNDFAHGFGGIGARLRYPIALELPEIDDENL